MVSPLSSQISLVLFSYFSKGKLLIISILSALFQTPLFIIDLTLFLRLLYCVFTVEVSASHIKTANRNSNVAFLEIIQTYVMLWHTIQNQWWIMLVGWGEVRWTSCFWVPLWEKGLRSFHVPGPRRLNVTFTTNDKLPHGIRHSVTDSCLRGLVHALPSSSSPLMQPLINRREKIKQYINHLL